MYVMMTAQEVIEKLWEMPADKRALDFTFDDLDLLPETNPTGWHGVKFTKIFDEEDCVLAIGYYGGGSTVTYDIYGLCDYSNDEECVKEFCAEKLQEYMNTWNDSAYKCRKICVELIDNTK